MKRQICSSLLVASLQLPAIPLFAEGAPAAAPEAETAPGEPRRSPNCVSLARIQQTKVLDDRTILFELTGRETLVNRLPHRCPGLGFEKAFGYETSLTELCSQDIIWVVYNTPEMRRGARCGLGNFEPWVEPPEPDAADAPKDKGNLKPM